jgi:hypothetical protein
MGWGATDFGNLLLGSPYGPTSILSCYVSKLYMKVSGRVLMMEKRHTAEEEQSLRQYILCQEDRATLTGETWNGGYRWFRAENVVCLEHYRAAETKSAPRLKAS